jgi:hypothetical protein
MNQDDFKTAGRLQLLAVPAFIRYAGMSYG